MAGSARHRLRSSELYPPNCPPASATAADGVVFRLLMTSPPTELDFASHRERQPGKTFSNPCDACGVSVVREAADVTQLLAMPALRDRPFVWRGVLRPEMGVLAPTPSRRLPSHHTWWVQGNAKPWDEPDARPAQEFHD